MSERKWAIILTVLSVIAAVAVANLIIPEPTGDSSVYEQYTEEMRENGRYPNGEPLGDAYQQEVRKRMRDAGIWLDLGR